MPEKRYIVGGMDGRLNLKREPPGSIVAVPEFIEVDLERSSGGRDFFAVLEGVERGKRFSVKSGNLKAATRVIGARPHCSSVLHGNR